jgi:hypothetical protein
MAKSQIFRGRQGDTHEILAGTLGDTAAARKRVIDGRRRQAIERFESGPYAKAVLFQRNRSCLESC